MNEVTLMLLELPRVKDFHQHYCWIQQNAKLGDVEPLKRLFRGLSGGFLSHFIPMTTRKSLTTLILQALAVSNGALQACTAVDLLLRNTSSLNQEMKPLIASCLADKQSREILVVLLEDLLRREQHELAALLLQEALLRGKLGIHDPVATRTRDILNKQKHLLEIGRAHV